jgi:hypothetical protein
MDALVPSSRLATQMLEAPASNREIGDPRGSCTGPAKAKRSFAEGVPKPELGNEEGGYAVTGREFSASAVGRRDFFGVVPKKVSPFLCRSSAILPMPWLPHARSLSTRSERRRT